MSSCHNCGDFRIFDDCCDKKEPTILTKNAFENDESVLVTVNYEEEPFNGLVLTGGEFGTGVDSPSLNLVNVPPGTIFSLVLDLKSGQTTSAAGIVIDSSGLIGSIENENNIVIVGKKGQPSRLV